MSLMFKTQKQKQNRQGWTSFLWPGSEWKKILKSGGGWLGTSYTFGLESTVGNPRRHPGKRESCNERRWKTKNRESLKRDGYGGRKYTWKTKYLMRSEWQDWRSVMKVVKNNATRRRLIVAGPIRGALKKRPDWVEFFDFARPTVWPISYWILEDPERTDENNSVRCSVWFFSWPDSKEIGRSS